MIVHGIERPINYRHLWCSNPWDIQTLEIFRRLRYSDAWDVRHACRHSDTWDMQTLETFRRLRHSDARDIQTLETFRRLRYLDAWDLRHACRHSDAWDVQIVEMCRHLRYSTHWDTWDLPMLLWVLGLSQYCSVVLRHWLCRASWNERTIRSESVLMKWFHAMLASHIDTERGKAKHSITNAPINCMPHHPLDGQRWGIWSFLVTNPGLGGGAFDYCVVWWPYHCHIRAPSRVGIRQVNPAPRVGH
jgi:hypothetical protein